VFTAAVIGPYPDSVQSSAIDKLLLLLFYIILEVTLSPMSTMVSNRHIVQPPNDK
jgi:hypothetical protein